MATRGELGKEQSGLEYRDLLEGVGAAIFALDLEGRFIFLNAQAIELLGYDESEAGELVGKHFSNIVGPDQIQEAQTLFAEGSEMRPFILQALRKDGTPVNVEVSGAWVRRRGQRVAALAMGWQLSPADNIPTKELTKLDLTILQLISTGRSNREIAEQVYLSAHTVKDRVERIMRYFGVTRRTELAAKAARQGLV